MASKETKLEDVPQIIENPKTNTTYRRGNFLGKGGFARCYEFRNTSTNEIYAGKVVSKSILVKPHHKEKMVQEIKIHSSLSHKYIVSLHSYFEDKSNMYIILELCRKRSLMEMHKRRKILSIPEVRYFMQQIVLACQYMHENRVIHRDLKLGNLFISENMEIKVGDFGLATFVAFEGERKKTLCGTPNYIAPEILLKKGHSYEVDIWSLGCIMYTLLVGAPPFETSSLKTTYEKIKNNKYFMPLKLDSAARYLIQKMLHKDPERRPTAEAILKDEFFNGYIPSRLPQSCLVMHPRLTHNLSLLDETKPVVRKPLVEKNIQSDRVAQKDSITKVKGNLEMAVKILDYVENNMKPTSYYLKELLMMVESVLTRQVQSAYKGNPEDAQDPSAVPFMWISKWVDYSDKYGLGYQLCENSIGVYFNDLSHLIMLADGKTFQYINMNDEESFYTADNFPEEMNKKLKLFDYFRKYMNENLSAAGENAKHREGDEMIHVPHLRAYLRMNSAIIFLLSNGTFQANFFKDHTKIILCPLMGAVSYIDEEKNFTVYSFKLIKEFGCPSFLTSRLSYARSMLQRLYLNFKDKQKAKK